MKNSLAEIGSIATAISLVSEATRSFPVVNAANDLVPVRPPQAQQVRVITAEHLAQMRAPGSDCL